MVTWCIFFSFVFACSCSFYPLIQWIRARISFVTTTIRSFSPGSNRKLINSSYIKMNSNNYELNVATYILDFFRRYVLSFALSRYRLVVVECTFVWWVLRTYANAFTSLAVLSCCARKKEKKHNMDVINVLVLVHTQTISQVYNNYYLKCGFEVIRCANFSFLSHSTVM